MIKITKNELIDLYNNAITEITLRENPIIINLNNRLRKVYDDGTVLPLFEDDHLEDLELS